MRGLELVNTACASHFRSGLRFAAASTFASPLSPTAATLGSAADGQQTVNYDFAGTPFGGQAFVSAAYGIQPFNPESDTTIRADVAGKQIMLRGLWRTEHSGAALPLDQRRQLRRILRCSIMTQLTATPDTLAESLKACAAGDTLSLAPGNYGPLAIAKRTFEPPLTIKSADPKTPAMFSKVTISGGGGIVLQDLAIRYAPDETTMADTPVVYLNGVKDITVRGGSVASGPAVNGVDEAALKLVAGGNVLGWPTCRGFYLLNCDGVTIEGVDLHHTHRGIILTKSKRVSILGNDIHHLRKTGIAGGASDLRIEANHFHSNRPWRYGQTPAGDHGDWFAIWTDAGGLTGVYIRDNLMETGEGLPMMGGWIAGKNGGVIDGWEYSGNTVLGGDHQGFMAGGPSGVRNGVIRGNTLLQDDRKAKPLGIILQKSAVAVEIVDNVAGSISDRAVLKANTVGMVVDPAKAAALRAAWLWQRRGGPPTPPPAAVGTLTLGGKVYDVVMRGELAE